MFLRHYFNQNNLDLISDGMDLDHANQTPAADNKLYVCRTTDVSHLTV